MWVGALAGRRVRSRSQLGSGTSSTHPVAPGGRAHNAPVLEPPIPCVGAVIRDAQGRFLLVQRANEPGHGLWSLPGGRVEPGETDAGALRREVAEEVGLQIRVGNLAGEVHRPGPAGTIFVIRDYVCTVTGGQPTPGTDALDARFAQPGDVPVTPGLWETLAAWNLL